MQKIEDYSTDSSALTQATYTEAGVVGVTVIALDTINALIAAAADGAADTVAEVQDIVNQGLALQKIEDYTTGSSALTQATYTEAGIMGVTENTINAINVRVLAAADGAADTVAEVQEIVNQGAFITSWHLTDSLYIIFGVTEGYSKDTMFDIDWNNDGDYDDIGITQQISNRFESPGYYDISIRGDYPQMPLMLYESSSHPLIDVKQWGDNVWENMSNQFSELDLEGFSAKDLPDTSRVTDMSSMFDSSSSFDGDIGSWDVSAVTNMRAMFNNAGMDPMNDENWDIASFNSDISLWDVSAVTDMSAMFINTSFNQNISEWVVSSVTTMQSMFILAVDFNQDIGGWDVSAVTNMSSMLNKARGFNQDIGGWDVSAVTVMHSMLYEAGSFNQDIGGWDVSAVTEMGHMFDGSGLSVANYDSLLSGWTDINYSGAEKTLLEGVVLGVNGMIYSDATARDYLQAEWNWTVQGDSLEAGVMVGDANDNVLGNSVSNADQIIHGLGGSDTITGGKGDDLINGGTGNNTLTGGDGKDTFRYSHLDLSTAAVSDTITDFSETDDALDLSVLLDGFGVAGYGTSAADFINLSADSNGDLQLSIDLNGQALDTVEQPLQISLANIVFNANTHTGEWLTDLQSSGNLVLV